MNKSAFYFALAATLGLAAPLIAKPAVAPGQVGLDAPNADDGQAIFKQRCSGCHATKPGEKSSAANLSAIVGRGAAAAPGTNYSEALKTSGIAWTREALDSYLAAPQKVVPGTWMPVSLPDPAQRAHVVDYLASISPTPVPITTVPPIDREHDQHAGH